jgi:DNA-binding LacI/PurR family transcriptional regulator
MADIARMAGVSIATVSRALNGSPLVQAETRTRIEDLARSLNYTINLSAKNLRLKANRSIAVVIPYDARSPQLISDPFFLSMVGGLADAITAQGHQMLLSRVDADNLLTAAAPFDTGMAVGVILIGQWRHHDHLNQLAARHVPIVVWGGELSRQIYCTIGGDNLQGGKLATQHLLSLGRRRILFLGDPQLPEVALRLTGYEQALAEAGLSPNRNLIARAPFGIGQASAAIEQVLQRGTRFDAVFACSDLLAAAALGAMRAHNLTVPQDVAVVGYDDVELASHTHPPLTTIRQPIARAGAALVDALLAMLRGEPARSTVLPVELVARDSTRG